MSRSNNTELVNPCTHWFQWEGSTGEVSYYDKATETKVKRDLPLHFLLLDVLHTVKGWDKIEESGIWSNEVKDVKNQPLSVRNKNGVICQGAYSVVKETITSKGGKYAQSCYIAFKDTDGVYKIGNIMIMGSAFGGGKYKKNVEGKNFEVEVGAWMEFCKKNQNVLYKNVITMDKNPQLLELGATKFYAPKFTSQPVTKPETEQIAIDLDKELQEYLTAYFKKQGQTETPVIPQEVIEQQEFEKYDAEQRAKEDLAAHKERIAQNNAPAHIASNADENMPF